MKVNTESLQFACCSKPFDILGIIPDGKGGATVRCWFPNAVNISLLPWHDTPKKLEIISQLEQVDQNGLFELYLKEYDGELFRYRVAYKDVIHTKLDPYQFSDLRFNDSFFDTCRIYYHQGAHIVQKTIQGKDVHGVRFSIYAPNARAISVVGDFNDWDGRMHPMQSSNDGVWRLFIPDVEVGQGYKYEIKNRHGDVLPLKIDPFAFSVDQFPSFACRIFDHNRYKWHDDNWQNRGPIDYLKEPINIYEVHLGSWNHIDGNPLTYRQLIYQLIPYIKEMGYTHIELMPISEYPFDGSWGYQPVGMFAPTSRYGSPEDFKTFIDACHQEEIGVILDWVPAHFPTDTHGLTELDGSNLYEYEDPRKGWHPDWNSLIYDYGREHVCRFLISNAIYWFEMFHIDGIRVDAVASMLYLDYARQDGEWIPNIDGGNENYEAISFLKRLNETIYLNYPNAMTIAEESTAFSGVSKPTYEGGLGFGFKWNMGWMNDSLRYMQKDSIHRKYHHDEMTFSLIYAFDEHFILPLSHDEVVHGKRSLLDKMPGDSWQKFANLRAFMGYMYAHPGKKLNFMGNEIAQGKEWNHNDTLDWDLLEQKTDLHRSHKNLIKDLNYLYKNEPSLHQEDYNSCGFNWLIADDAENSVLAFVRFATDPIDHLVIITNFTPIPRDKYVVEVPTNVVYHVILNTDQACYAGSDYHCGKKFATRTKTKPSYKQSICLNLPPLATLFLKPEQKKTELVTYE